MKTREYPPSPYEVRTGEDGMFEVYAKRNNKFLFRGTSREVEEYLDDLTPQPANVPIFGILFAAGCVLLAYFLLRAIS